MSKPEPILLIEDTIESANKMVDYTSSLSFNDFIKDGKPIDQ